MTLEDRNLELIAEKRILRPIDDAAGQRIADAFRCTDDLPGITRDVLLTDADGDASLRTYPFSPAFMQMLVHVSSALQRERTALKLMQQILVEIRGDPASVSWSRSVTCSTPSPTAPTSRSPRSSSTSSTRRATSISARCGPCCSNKPA